MNCEPRWACSRNRFCNGFIDVSARGTYNRILAKDAMNPGRVRV